MDTYNIFLDYYDKIVRNTTYSLKEEVDFLLYDCIKKYKPDSRTILEVACWTWVIWKKLINKSFDYIGLDINKKMLKKAEENIDKKNLILWDMTNFQLSKKFDVVLCNYNSICHLLKWEDWQKFFIQAYNNLEKNWLLIFDINTLYEFECITNDFAQFYNIYWDTVCMEMFKKDWYFEWLIKMFKKRKDGKYDLIEENVKENSFSVEKIKKELKKIWFDILDVIDYHFVKISDTSERVYFLCKKI